MCPIRTRAQVLSLAAALTFGPLSTASATTSVAPATSQGAHPVDTLPQEAGPPASAPYREARQSAREFRAYRRERRRALRERSRTRRKAAPAGRSLLQIGFVCLGLSLVMWLAAVSGRNRSTGGIETLLVDVLTGLILGVGALTLGVVGLTCILVGFLERLRD